MGRRVRSSFPESKDLPYFTSPALKASRQLSSHPRRTWGPTSDILHVKSSPRCRDSLPKLEKLILALVVSTRKLRPYYQAHRVIIMTDFPLRSILHSPDASQLLMKWAIKLSQ
ncbi:unnamed protein product [Prunus armeniaca]